MMVCFDFQYENMANENTNDDNNRNERKQNDQFAVPGSSWLICPKCIPESIGRMKSCWSSLRAFWTMAPPARKREKITITFVSEFAIIGNEDFEFTFAVNFTAFFDTFVRLFQVFNVRILENKLRRNTMENPGLDFSELLEVNFFESEISDEILIKGSQNEGEYAYEAPAKRCLVNQQSVHNNEDYTDNNVAVKAQYKFADGVLNPGHTPQINFQSRYTGEQPGCSRLTTHYSQNRMGCPVQDVPAYSPGDTTALNGTNHNGECEDERSRKRKRNNEAAKKSREKRKTELKYLKMRNQELEEGEKIRSAKMFEVQNENNKLKEQLQNTRQKNHDLEKENAKLLKIFELMLKKNLVS